MAKLCVYSAYLFVWTLFISSEYWINPFEIHILFVENIP